MTQSNAQMLTFAKAAGKYVPDDALEFGRCIEVLDLVEDVAGYMAPTFAEKDDEKKKSARTALVKAGEGRVWRWVHFIDARLGAHAFAATDKTLSVADFKLFYALQWFTSGMLDHIDGDALLADTKHVRAYLARVAATDEIVAFEKYWDAAKPAAPKKD